MTEIKFYVFGIERPMSCGEEINMRGMIHMSLSMSTVLYPLYFKLLQRLCFFKRVIRSIYSSQGLEELPTKHNVFPESVESAFPKG